MNEEVYDRECPSTFQCWICDTINLQQVAIREFKPKPTWDYDLGSSDCDESVIKSVLLEAPATNA
jgi:hypothetical protein